MNLKFQVVVSVCVFLAACTTLPDTSVDTLKIIDEFRAKNTQIAIEEDTSVHEGIKGVEVTNIDGDYRISLHLENADPRRVLLYILEKTGTHYVIGAPFLGSGVSLKVNDISLEKALNLLSQNQRVVVLKSSGVVTIDAAKFAQSDTDIITRTHFLKFVTAKAAEEILLGFHENAIDEGSFSFGRLPSSNAIIMTGVASNIITATTLLEKMDRQSEHVFVEALVVEFNIEKLRDIGTQISGGARGSLSSFFLDVANGSGSNLSFNYDGAISASDLSFGLAMDFLEQEDIARVLSRPFLSTISGKTASLEITEDRFIETVINDEAELNEVSSGVIVNITPVVTSNKSIILQFSVSESRFAATEEDDTIRRSRNAVESTAQVNSGQTVVIGGLSLKTRAITRAGLPVTKLPPFISSIFGHQASRSQDTEVMIFITPRVWTPSMDIPVPVELDIRQATPD